MAKRPFQDYEAPHHATTPFDGDPFTSTTNIFSNNAQASNSSNQAHQAPQVNPYAQDANSYGGAGYFQNQSNYQQPVRNTCPLTDES